jgi:hypothetical protein
MNDQKAVITGQKHSYNAYFKWAMLRTIFPVKKNTERISDLKNKFDFLNWSDMTPCESKGCC